MCQQPRKARQTALFDALLSARGLLGVPNVGDVIYGLTDAVDNNSRTKPKKVEDALLTAGVRLFGVVINLDPLLRGREIMSDSPNQFHSVVEATGARHQHIPPHCWTWRRIHLCLFRLSHFSFRREAKLYFP